MVRFWPMLFLLLVLLIGLGALSVKSFAKEAVFEQILSHSCSGSEFVVDINKNLEMYKHNYIVKHERMTEELAVHVPVSYIRPLRRDYFYRIPPPNIPKMYRVEPVKPGFAFSFRFPDMLPMVTRWTRKEGRLICLGAENKENIGSIVVTRIDNNKALEQGDITYEKIIRKISLAKEFNVKSEQLSLQNIEAVHGAKIESFVNFYYNEKNKSRDIFYSSCNFPSSIRRIGGKCIMDFYISNYDVVGRATFSFLSADMLTDIIHSVESLLSHWKIVAVEEE